MIQDPGRNDGMGWLEASGLPRIIRSLKVTVQPEKLAIGLVGVFLTFVWGGVLDWGNSLLSEEGIGQAAITEFILAGELDRDYDEPKGTNGIFEVWRLHEKGCVLRVLGSSVPGSSVAGGTLLGKYVDTHTDARPLRNVVSMIYGVWWLLAQHPVYFVLFTIGFLLIWSWCGGAICRMAALESARDERIGIFEALGYSRDKLIGGFFLAPIVPIGFNASGTICTPSPASWITRETGGRWCSHSPTTRRAASGSCASRRGWRGAAGSRPPFACWRVTGRSPDGPARRRRPSFARRSRRAGFRPSPARSSRLASRTPSR